MHPRRLTSKSLVTPVFFILIAGCAVPAPRDFKFERPPPPHTQAAVFCCDGAGDFRNSSTYLRKVVTEDAEPLFVRTVIWSHGPRRIISDQVDYAYARMQGQKLACDVEAYHAAHPETPIHLWAHSAGAIVVIAALEELPPGIVQQVVLLSPSTSAYYDLRRALQSVCREMHVFHSKRDCLYLGVATCILGSSDRRRGPMGGRTGFKTIVSEPGDEELYAKLIQHPWTPSDRATGNAGGHYGGYQPEFLRQNVIPLLR